jgi:hypothetical protein
VPRRFVPGRYLVSGHRPTASYIEIRSLALIN